MRYLYFYTRTWPELDKFQKKIPSNHQFQKLPKCLSSTLEGEYENIVLENLRLQDFQMHDRKVPLNKEHFEYIFREYGKFHGISFAYKTTLPDEYANLIKGFTNLYLEVVTKEDSQKGMKYMFETCKDSLQKGVDDAVIEKVNFYIENYKTFLLDTLQGDTEYSTITHGDCWSNNMMFKYDDQGKLIDLRFLDFQLARPASPCCDLSYCLYSGASKEILQNLDYYIQVYRQSLSETLNQFGYDSEKLYPLKEMMKDWKRYCKLGFSFALMVWKMKFTYEEDLKDHTDLENDERDKILHSSYDEDAFKKVIRDLFLHLQENDFL